MLAVQNFYNRINFPGQYQIDQLKDISNQYLLCIDQALHNGQTVLDVGCGTGLVSNLFGIRYPDSTFTAIDFADGDVKFESVDQIVTDQLTNIESEFYDNKLLLKIYQTL